MARARLSARRTTCSIADERLRPMLAALSRDLAMVVDPVDADVVHAHTWYTHLAGMLVARSPTASRSC